MLVRMNDSAVYNAYCDTVSFRGDFEESEFEELLEIAFMQKKLLELQIAALEKQEVDIRHEYVTDGSYIPTSRAIAVSEVLDK